MKSICFLQNVNNSPLEESLSKMKAHQGTFSVSGIHEIQYNNKILNFNYHNIDTPIPLNESMCHSSCVFYVQMFDVAYIFCFGSIKTKYLKSI